VVIPLREIIFFLLVLVLLAVMFLFHGCSYFEESLVTTTTQTPTTNSSTTTTTAATTTTSTVTTTTTTTTTSSSTTTTTTMPIVLKNLGVTIEAYDPSTKMAGAIVFFPSRFKVFLEFGVSVETSPGSYKTLPTFEYYTTPEAVVFSPIDGTVNWVGWQPSTGDYEMSIQSANNSSWLLFVDHVKDITVTTGDAVSAWQVLGKVGTVSADTGRTEIQVRASNIDWAPFKYFDPATTAEYQQKITDLMASWEAYKGDPSIYDEAAMAPYWPGCLNDNIP